MRAKSGNRCGPTFVLQVSVHFSNSPRVNRSPDGDSGRRVGIDLRSKIAVVVFGIHSLEDIHLDAALSRESDLVNAVGIVASVLRLLRPPRETVYGGQCPASPQSRHGARAAVEEILRKITLGRIDNG